MICQSSAKGADIMYWLCKNVATLLYLLNSEELLRDEGLFLDVFFKCSSVCLIQSCCHK